MPSRSRTSFKKRQKELLRVEKQREKAANRLARRSAPKETGDVEPEIGPMDADTTEPRDDNPADPDSGKAPAA
jgi:hypothetical protein